MGKKAKIKSCELALKKSEASVTVPHVLLVVPENMLERQLLK